jgi:hypothetical protein
MLDAVWLSLTLLSFCALMNLPFGLRRFFP